LITSRFKNFLSQVSEESQKKRWEICNRCEFLTKSLKRCQKCGCFMALKVKFDYASCPKGKW